MSALVQRGGPRPEEYSELDQWITDLYAALNGGEISQGTTEAVRQAMSPVLAAPTMHGFAYSKPHGYAGDFEIIDSRNSLILALLTFGEGWHNNQHAAPRVSYNNWRGYEFDLNGFLIRLLSRGKLVWNVKELNRKNSRC